VKAKTSHARGGHDLCGEVIGHAGEAQEGSLIEPLRKIHEGRLYTRPKPIEDKLHVYADVPREELAKRCRIRDRRHPDYIPSECLLHLVRATRNDNSDAWFEQVFTELIARFLLAFPKEPRDGAETVGNEGIREGARDWFLERLALDRDGYCDQLDFFEIRFDQAVKKLRYSMLRRAVRSEQRRGPLEHEETGEILNAVELAKGLDTVLDPENFSNPVYRSRLDAAIASLPREQREIMEMLRLDFPIDSKEPDEMTIVKALGCAEKTVRNRRDRAILRLRELLVGGEK
jgi:hypothetical protein